MAATMPGARLPGVMDAAFSTPEAVKVGVCACAESASRENEIAMPMNVVRNVLLRFRENCIEISLSRSEP
jgi:hypothetical protein